MAPTRRLLLLVVLLLLMARISMEAEESWSLLVVVAVEAEKFVVDDCDRLDLAELCCMVVLRRLLRRVGGT